MPKEGTTPAARYCRDCSTCPEALTGQAIRDRPQARILLEELRTALCTGLPARFQNDTLHVRDPLEATPVPGRVKDRLRHCRPSAIAPRPLRWSAPDWGS